MRRMWTRHELLRIAGVEITGKDTMRRMWTRHELLRIAGVEITGKDTMRRMWSKDELIDLNQLEDPYKNYALNIYKKSNLENIFADAWEDMKEVDGAEIERDSTAIIQYGNLQYPNGEDNGVIIPDSVTSIGVSAFRNWEANNQPLVIPNSVISIGGSAFRYWIANNQPLVIPDSVTIIGDWAFRDWQANNQPLVIPDSVTSIGIGAFEYWSNVPYVEMKSETPPTLGSSSAFGDQNNAPIYVPDGSVDDYKNETNWSALASRIFSINEK